MDRNKRSFVCSVCGKNEANYRCPCCEERTCSLDCVQLHKTLKNCAGKRPRTNFTSMKQFTDQTLISDLHFLEDVKRVKETNWRNLRRVALVFQPQEILPHQRKLRYEARQRGMNLRFLPKGMSRNKSNTSWFDFRKGEICWDIDWIILGSPIRRKRVSESETVQSALTNAWSTPSENIIVLMRKEQSPSNEALYFEFDLNASLKSQLEGKEVVEYPVLIVVKLQDCSNYNLVKDLEIRGTTMECKS